MASLNRIMVIGNVGRDPEMRFTGSGKPVTSFSVATTRKYTAGGEQKEETQWFTIVAWGKLAETCNQYVEKGRQIYVDGRLQVAKWEGQDGEKKHRVEIVANTVLFLGKKSDTTQEESQETEEEDLPF